MDATAEKGEDFLIQMLDTDEGARRLGELEVGTNYGITEGTERSGWTRRSAERCTSPSRALSRDGGRQRVGDPLGHDL